MAISKLFYQLRGELDTEVVIHIGKGNRRVSSAEFNAKIIVSVPDREDVIIEPEK